jgi:hypothetical protein
MNGNIIIIKGIDAKELVETISALSRKYQAIIMNKLESLEIPQEIFPEVRKIILDNINDFGREVGRDLIGDVES